MKLTSEQIHEIAERVYNDMCEAIEIVVNDVVPGYNESMPNMYEDPFGHSFAELEDNENEAQILKAVASRITQQYGI
jgi:hypothetical protein